ncbi:ABC transporter ATP-binding protein [Ammoniphilus resinae]|uniref:Branched-chain amino acid transport system ATP-binding protein n=1 Tax=Ammoniphilus resinae TaxID=861532 RepID=A0ABS4GRT5_9BACL|nr:ABC transporter ATP-binding protein [Ammoniphilus resinae]MBP1932560.1 branched-chain amino acid transport system ATP-binding protein [Ammoniphilus resinae]
MVLEVRGITKRFGGIQALTDVTFQVGKGEVFGLIGPNGAGKTTMFNIITSMFPPTMGEVIFMGKKLTGLKPHEVTEAGVCRTFQNIRLFPEMTVLENVTVGQHCRTKSGVWSSVFRTGAQKQEEKSIREKALELLRLVGLEELQDTFADNLAYGQQRRLEIARALASDPKLLLLDEPAAGMNESETKDLFDLIQNIKKLGITVLLIEHDMPLVMRICDRLIVLNFGKEIAQGTPEEIKNNPEVIEAYLGREEEEDLA